MKKVILVDGNNLLFRSYYATAYSGNLMKNSKGFPTNALFGLTNMLNKIIKEENPEYMLVAFDKGKTFRHEKYKEYKAGRIKTPDDLVVQFKPSRELTRALGIKCFEIDNYEADDIIGTYSKLIDEDPDYEGIIVSSDKDLLQLISPKVKVKLLKTKDYIMMDEDEFKKTYGLEPIKMIDLKGLMGDASDNIPGVKGIGEKTAIKLLQEYGSVENLYDHIDELKGATKDKLVQGKEDAFISKEMATIYKEVPVEYKLSELKLDETKDELKDIYEDLEFYSFLKNIRKNTILEKNESSDIKVVTSLNEIKLDKTVSVFIETDNPNYHDANVLGITMYDGKSAYFLPIDLVINNKEFFNLFKIYTYDNKKNIVVLNKYGISFKTCEFDTMIAAYILNYNVKDDAAYLASNFNYEVMFFNELMKSDKSIETLSSEGLKKAKFIFETKDKLEQDMKDENSYDLFKNIEMKLSFVLASMEIEGIRVDREVLKNMGEKINKKMLSLEKEIYELAGLEFNIQSPKQLGEVLFDKMGIPYPKKKKTSYSTSREILDKIKDDNPIIDKIIDYRTLAKLHSTYIVGIDSSIKEDSKLHTIYTQTLTRTGRLSSIEPNLQNIPIRYEEGKLIRKAFIPEADSVFISSDYSQIELRIFAHMSNEENMMEAFNNDLDIHTKTAMDIFHVPKDKVTKLMRRQAKAVNFGILYGISNFGLAEDIGTDFGTAKKFMDTYLDTFPKIREYNQKVIDDAYKNGYVLTIMNRKRKIEELDNTNYIIRQQGERIAQNTPIQGSAADILKLAMINIYDEFNKQGIKSKMILQIHDELIFNVLNSEKDKVKKIIKDKMENVYKLNVPLVVDIEEGTNWYDTK
ncbi:MAG: DNA polymerase I [Bacilli bacterium]|nr:DNA polymerase I [Bacilli bacterium]